MSSAPGSMRSRVHPGLAAVVLCLSTAACGARVENMWCKQVDLPAHEKQFGFRFDQAPVHTANGSQSQAWAFVAVDPGGILARAGVVAGDVPRLAGGISEICSVFDAAARGSSVTLDLANIGEYEAGRYRRRRVTIGGIATPHAK